MIPILLYHHYKRKFVDSHTKKGDTIAANLRAEGRGEWTAGFPSAVGVLRSLVLSLVHTLQVSLLFIVWLSNPYWLVWTLCSTLVDSKTL